MALELTYLMRQLTSEEMKIQIFEVLAEVGTAENIADLSSSGLTGELMLSFRTEFKQL